MAVTLQLPGRLDQLGTESGVLVRHTVVSALHSEPALVTGDGGEDGNSTSCRAKTPAHHSWILFVCFSAC